MFIFNHSSFTDTTEPVTQPQGAPPQEFSTEEPKPFYLREKYRPTTPYPPDDWTKRVETAAPIIMGLAAVADATSQPISLVNDSMTPPVPVSQVSAFLAAQPALTRLPEAEPSETTSEPAGDVPTTEYEDLFLPNLDKDNDLDLVPVLPESWNPAKMPAFWYPEKGSEVEKGRRSRLLTYRH